MKNQWFRMYSEAVDDEKLRLLAPSDRWYYVALLCLKCDGLLDNNDKPELKERKLAVKLELTPGELSELRRRLSEVGLIDQDYQPLKWAKRQFVGSKNLPEGESLDGHKGYVYFIGSLDGPVKVGYSKNPWARVKEFQTGSPNELHVLATLKTMEVSERNVHELFATERMSGEWFERTEVMLSVIKGIKNKKIKTQLDLSSYVAELRRSYVATTTDTETDTDNSLSLRSRESGRAQTVEPEINTAKPRRSQTGTRLPDDWEPSDEDVAFARRERPDVDWRAEAEGFRDYWHAKAGAGARKVDWSATWRNWIRRADGMRKPAPARQQAPAAPGKTMQALMALEAMKHGNELDSDGNFAGLPAVGLLGS